MDQLQDIFERQQAFNASVRAQRKLEFDQCTWIQKETLAMLSELSEVLDEVNFKWWKNAKPVNEDALKEEIIDLMHFLVSMALDSGMDAQEFHARYCRKNQENFDRQAGRSSKQGYAVAETPVQPD